MPKQAAAKAAPEKRAFMLGGRDFQAQGAVGIRNVYKSSAVLIDRLLFLGLSLFLPLFTAASLEATP